MDTDNYAVIERIVNHAEHEIPPEWGISLYFGRSSNNEKNFNFSIIGKMHKTPHGVFGLIDHSIMDNHLDPEKYVRHYLSDCLYNYMKPVLENIRDGISHDS